MPAFDPYDSAPTEVAQPGASTRPIHIAPPTVWLITAIAVSLVLGGYVLIQARAVVILLFVAIIFAEGIRPLVAWLRARGVPRALCVLLIYLVVLAALVILAWILLQPLTAQLVSLIDHLPDEAARLQQLLRDLQQQAGSNS